ncbi:IS6 family transposase [Xenorhabdus ehlersii]|uniref:Transposase n=1 Tax=Xenorhabdus ehlersii TaxID=290111 RepID=A0A2D0IK75_9GAMM|nr:IS6 family transposase [Xenorhabdus ehlersii]PHM22182.1 transposase [Xenorhabdus ehlersii]RKE87045.1 transposase-like protein [Xenorhabdus ehlersii]
MSLIRKAFKRLHYPVDIIAQCVRWYLAYALSLRNLEEMMAERGIEIDHSTIHRWVLRLVPLLGKAFRPRKKPVGPRWRMDETYIKVKGQWKYLYRAVDTAALTLLNAEGSPQQGIEIRQNKYLNNRIEQDHRHVKRRIRPMLGFKSFRRAQTILAGIALVSMLRKGQYLQPEDKTLSPARRFYRLTA